MAVPELIFLLVAAVAAFAVSSSAGLGGSLVMVPSAMVIFGPKQGVAVAALLLAMNNVAKFIAYRETLPIRRSLRVIVPTVIGTVFGALLLTRVPDRWVVIAVLASLAASLVAEATSGRPERPVGSPILAVAAGATSGFSGTSGPLKGVAIRGLGLDHRYTVGAATLVSLAGDVTKTITFASSGLLAGTHYLLAFGLIPAMAGGTYLGYRMNDRLEDRGYAAWFWLVMGGYSLRLLGVWPG